MGLEYKQELKIWLIYFGTILLSMYIHETGHCIPAWFHGYVAIPTPAKEYISETIPDGLQQSVSLGGIAGSVIVSMLLIIIYLFKKLRFGSALLAGAISMPGMYSIRFILIGRGHDATEFQEAQTALGFNYSGHSLDWIFLIIFSAGLITWILKSKPRFRIAGRLVIGFILTIIFAVGIQFINNKIFDPVFLHN